MRVGRGRRLVVSSLTALNVCTILGDRLDLASLQDKYQHGRERVVRTQSGREIRAELVVRPFPISLSPASSAFPLGAPR